MLFRESSGTFVRTFGEYLYTVENYIHTIAIVSFSPYFQALLGTSWEDGRKDEIEILYLDESTVGDLIELAYSGNIDISKDNVQTLLEAANYWGVEFVKNSWGDFLDFDRWQNLYRHLAACRCVCAGRSEERS